MFRDGRLRQWNFRRSQNQPADACVQNGKMAVSLAGGIRLAEMGAMMGYRNRLFNLRYFVESAPPLRFLPFSICTTSGLSPVGRPPSAFRRQKELGDSQGPMIPVQIMSGSSSYASMEKPSHRHAIVPKNKF